MNLDDLFKQRRDGHHDDYYGEHRDGHHGGLERYLHLFEKQKNNKKLWIALFVAAIFVVIIVIAVIIILIPLIAKGFESIQKSGIKGLFESAIPLLENLWSGKGK